MSAKRQEPVAERSLAEIEADLRSLPVTLPCDEYKRRTDTLMEEWRAANVALFDLQVALIDRVREHADDLLEDGRLKALALLEESERQWAAGRP